MFMESLKETLNNEKQLTENGALGYRTSGKALLDLNFNVASLRNKSEEEIASIFANAFYESPILAMKWLFYCRDARGGIGERRTFRTCMVYLAINHTEVARAVLSLVPEYGRWDDVLCLLGTSLFHEVAEMMRQQLYKDAKAAKEGKPISLLAKWLPSCNTSSNETKRMAKILVKEWGTTEKEYRRLLSALRGYLKVVEVSMSKKEWRGIDYAAVPSRANVVYNNAFLRNDEARRRAYLEGVQKGETKINAGVLFPHDIVHKYNDSQSWRCRLREYDSTLEELWKALPDFVNGAGNTIVVADGSGSMNAKVGNTNVTALDVANALAIYFSERSSGQFKDNYITFSSRPQLVDFGKAKNLRQKLEIAYRHNEVADTNIEAVFDLVLETAIRNKMSQEDLPQNILILSDMEFNSCVRSCSGKVNQTLFENIARRYASHGYKMPRLVFWNICRRTGTIPVKENELGVALVSGFSPAIAKMVLSNSTDPFECLLEQLNSERYKAIEDAVVGLI